MFGYFWDFPRIERIKAWRVENNISKIQHFVIISYHQNFGQKTVKDYVILAKIAFLPL